MVGTKQMKKITEVISKLKVFWPDYEATADQFSKPTPASVIKFYERFMQEFSVKVDLIISILSQNYENFDKEHEDIAYIYILYLCFSYVYNMLEMTSLPSFTLSLTNFIDPANDRNLIPRATLLSNYLCWAKLMIEENLSPLREKVMQEATSIQTLDKVISNLHEDLERVASTRDQNIETLAGMNADKQKIKYLISERCSQSEELDKEIQELNAELKALEMEKDWLANEVEKNLQKGKELKSMIFDDHELISTKYKEIEKEISEARDLSPEYVVSLECKTKAETNLLQNYEKISKLCESTHLIEIMEIFEKIENYRSSIEKFVEENKSIQNTTTEKFNILHELHRELEVLEEKYVIVSSEMDSQKKYLYEQIDHYNNKLIECKEEFRKANTAAQDQITTLQNVENSCNHLAEAKSSLKQKLDEAIKEFENAAKPRDLFDDLIY